MIKKLVFFDLLKHCIYDLANLYKMFADNTRVQILWALSGEDMCVCDLAVLLGMMKFAVIEDVGVALFAILNALRAMRLPVSILPDN